VNELVGAFFDGHAVVVTFGATRITSYDNNDAPKEPIVNVTCRIAISPPAALELTSTLKNMLTAAAQDLQNQKRSDSRP
jgi:hypothetical protein